MERKHHQVQTNLSKWSYTGLWDLGESAHMHTQSTPHPNCLFHTPMCAPTDKSADNSLKQNILITPTQPAVEGKYHQVQTNLNKSSYTGRPCYIWYRRVKDGPQKAKLATV